MGGHLRVLSKGYPMNTNTTGLKMVFKRLCVLVLWTKVASALEGLRVAQTCKESFFVYADNTESTNDAQIVLKDMISEHATKNG